MPSDAAAAGFTVVSESLVPVATGDPARFIGQVRQTDVLPALQSDGLRGSRIDYAPGARSNWHVHTGEQALVVTRGRGLVQWEGLDRPIELHAGDWVHVRRGIPHWHGAAPDSEFSHLAITATGDTIWHEAVTDLDEGAS